VLYPFDKQHVQQVLQAQVDTNLDTFLLSYEERVRMKKARKSAEDKGKGKAVDPSDPVLEDSEVPGASGLPPVRVVPPSLFFY